MGENSKRLDCYTVTEGKGEREFWTRIGSAFENRDGSITCRLDAVPVNGKVVIREPNNRDRDHGDREGR